MERENSDWRINMNRELELFENKEESFLDQLVQGIEKNEAIKEQEKQQGSTGEKIYQFISTDTP